MHLSSEPHSGMASQGPASVSSRHFRLMTFVKNRKVFYADEFPTFQQPSNSICFVEY